jgi:hypothetical protein
MKKRPLTGVKSSSNNGRVLAIMDSDRQGTAAAAGKGGSPPYGCGNNQNQLALMPPVKNILSQRPVSSCNFDI